MEIKPLSNHVFIEPPEEKKITPSGIIIPETVEKGKTAKAKALAVGPGKTSPEGKLIPMSVKVGDIVLFEQYKPTEIEIEGKKYLFVNEDDILAILS
ncbi:MAG: co-chaperone GroES [Patescibacteria group bacterium]|nr:co-chaperone GroES [Patescibacteria group bacterium]